MRIKLATILVEDQNHALRFYTEVLGFEKRTEIPMGPYKWITLTSPEGNEDLELSLEPNVNPAARAFQQAMFQQNVPLTAFEVADMESEYVRLRDHGVVFSQPPTPTGAVIIAVFSDTCGNLIQLYQPV